MKNKIYWYGGWFEANLSPKNVPLEISSKIKNIIGCDNDYKSIPINFSENKNNNSTEKYDYVRKILLNISDLYYFSFFTGELPDKTI